MIKQLSIFDFLEEEKKKEIKALSQLDINIYNLLTEFFRLFNLKNKLFNPNSWQGICDEYYIYSLKLNKIPKPSEEISDEL